jgi:hypothetical protein
MAIIQSGASADLATIDPTSKALRVTLYDSAGNELVKEPSGGIYHLPVGLRLTAAVAAGSAVWAMRNGGTRTIYITEIDLLFGFDGTAAATTSRWELIRFSDANPSGGTAMTPVKHATAMAASSVQDARFNAAAALTVTGITFEDLAFAYGGCQRQVHATNALQLGLGALQRRGIFELAPNEGLALRTNIVAVIGDSCQGHIAWEEQ